MRYPLLFRIAAVVLALFFAGHTFGGMIMQKSMGPASDVVFASMKTVHFDFNGSSRTWYDFWFGFGLTASVFLAFSTFASWHFGRLPASAWPAVGSLVWGLCAACGALSALSFLYFFVGPGLFGAVAALLIGLGGLSMRSAAGSPA
jgi:hypothetical protein